MGELPSPSLEDELHDQLLHDAPPAFIALLIPGTLLYLSLLAFVKGRLVLFRVLSVPTLAAFWSSHYTASVNCAALRALLNFVVAVGSMKLLDIHALLLTNSFPQYTAGSQPPSLIMALILMTELRWESFTPNAIRLGPIPKVPFASSPRRREIFYSERVQLLLHLALFVALQSLPQYAAVKAFGILLTIYNIWTAMQLTLRYKTSPALFGPIYLADSLATFWTETWHNAFASPCLSLAYTPTLYLLSRTGVPRSVARSAGVLASFNFMAAFHMFALAPLLSDEGIKRIGVFFAGNGVLTVLEVGIWGKKKHWFRAVLAWSAEMCLATWTVLAFEIADGVLGADWYGLCKPGRLK